MTWSSLKHFLYERYQRSKKNFLGLSLLIFLGNFVFCLLMAVFSGIETHVVEPLFPPSEIEIKPIDSFFSKKEVDKILPKNISRLKNIKGVLGVYPRMEPTFPMSGYIEFRGTRYFVSAIIDAIDPTAINNHSEIGFINPPQNLSLKNCLSQNNCSSTAECSSLSERCEEQVPILISPLSVEIVNQIISKEHLGITKITPQMIADIPLELVGNITDQTGRKTVTKKFRIIGVNSRAMSLGATIPMGYMEQWNKEFGPANNTIGYSKVLLVVKNPDDIPTIISQLKSLGFSIVEKGSKWIGIIFLLFRVIFIIAGMGFVIAFGFAMGQAMLRSAENRRKEFGIFMAVGATTHDLKMLLWIESWLITFLGSFLGILCARLSSFLLDKLAVVALSDIQLNPSSYFHYPIMLWVGAIGVPLFVATLATFYATRLVHKQNTKKLLIAIE